MPIDPDKFNAAKAKAHAIKSASASPAGPISPLGTAPAASPVPAVAPKIHEIPADKLMAYLQAHVGKPLDLAQVKQEFALTDTAANKLAEKFIAKGIIEKSSHMVDAVAVSQISWPAGTTVKIEENPTFTYGELLEFIKTQTGTPVEKSSLINRFGMTAMEAEAVVGDIHAVKLVDAQGVILPLPQLEEVIKKELGHINLDAPYSFHTPSVSTPTPSPTASPPAAPIPPAPTPTGMPASTSAPAPAAAPVPITTAPSPAPITPPVSAPAPPVAAPAAPASPKWAKAKMLADAVMSRIPPEHRKRAIWGIVGSTAIVVASPWLFKDEGGAPTSPPTSAPAPAPAAAKAQPPQPEASAPTAPETSGLSPRYMESAWFTQLGEIKPVVEKILKTESAEEYGAPFFAELKMEGQEKVINLSKESMVAVYKALDRGTLNTIAAKPEDPYALSNCKVTAKDETTGITGTCLAHENLAKIRKEIEDVLTQALNQGEWKMRPPRLFAQNTITETYAWLRGELLKKANAEAAKK